MSSSRLIALALTALLLRQGAASAQVEALNPALAIAEVDSTAYEVAAGWESSLRLADIVEDGRSWRGFAAEGRTVMRLSQSLAAWGRAGYVRGVRSDVVMSESSDYSEVGPMAVADTVGGNKDSESYAFRAGFAWRGARASAGLDIRYSSLCEFRSFDPRPKADAVSAEVRLGGALDLGGGKSVGLFGSLRKYSQEVDIDFKNDRAGKATIFHMIGLGADYSRFAGANDKASYDGRRAGGGVSFSGPLSLAAEASRRHTEKALPGLQNALISETFDDCLHADALRRGEAGGWTTEIGLQADLSRLKLKMIIYDDGHMNYRRISTRQPYERKRSEVGISAGMARPGLVRLSAQVAYAASSEANSELARSVDVAAVSLGVAAEAVRKWRRAELVGGLDLSARRNVSAECMLGTRRTSESAAALSAVVRDFELLAANLYRAQASIKLSLANERWGCAPFVAVECGGLARSRGQGEGWAFALRAGVGF